MELIVIVPGVKDKETYLKNIYAINKVLLNKKILNGEKIKVGFFVIYDSSFPAKPLFEKMLGDEMFEPFIVIIPDTLRGADNLLEQSDKTFDALSKQYRNVYNSYDKNKKIMIDFNENFDIICTANPYDAMTYKYYQMENLSGTHVLPIYIPYGYFTLTYGRKLLQIPLMNYFWKIFVDSDLNYQEYKKYQKIKGANAVVTGYCKMDELAKHKKNPSDRKRIILAPHHTVSEWKDGLELSNFLTYSDFFLELPKLYPDIDFIFRPHQLLFVNLKKPELWGEEKTKKYLLEILSNPNVLYSDGGDYMELFVNSDGIIHDCGSFVAEYLFTENPSCYILRDEEAIEELFLPMGQKCLENYYKAYQQQDIIDFIDNVIIKGNDPLKEQRVKFVNSELKINYPNVAQEILNYIKSELMNI